MEGMLWGVAAMCVKDVVKNPYLKGRDYERNVRQVYRDVDNLRIAVDQVKANCTPEDLSTGEHAPYIKRAERQLKDSYRTLKKTYPRGAGLSRLLEHAATPGAEMHLLDIGKEANQTARGLGDLLSEIRFAKIGKKEEPPPPSSSGTTAGSASPSSKSTRRGSSPRKTYDMTAYENAVSDGSSTGSAQGDDLFDRDRALLRSSSTSSPSSSTSGHHDRSGSSSSSSRKRRSSSKHLSSDPATTSRRGRSHSTSKALASTTTTTTTTAHRLDSILENGAEREHALDNLQVGIDSVLAAPDAEHEGEAMEHMEHALAEVLRFQKTRGFRGASAVDEALGDAVEDLDESMQSLLAATGDRESKYAMRRLEHALQDVDHALSERQRHKARVSAHRPRPLVAEPVATVTAPPTRGKLRRQNTSENNRTRRYSMYK